MSAPATSPPSRVALLYPGGREDRDRADPSTSRFAALFGALQAAGLSAEHLPLLWDCDFMYGNAEAGGPERYVLCEINVSSVSPFPPSCIGPIVDAVGRKLGVD